MSDVISKILGESSLSKKDVVMDVLSQAGSYNPVSQETLQSAISLFGPDSEFVILVFRYNKLVAMGEGDDASEFSVSSILSGRALPTHDDLDDIDPDDLEMEIGMAAEDIFLWAAQRGIKPDFTPVWDEHREIEDIEADYKRNRGDLPL
jgi:hypothetical protein